MNRFTPHRLAPAVAICSVMVACGGGAPGDATPVAPADSTTGADAMSMSEDPPTDVPTSTVPPPVVLGGTDDAVADAGRQRCLGVGEILERRIEAEGFEWPDEGPELSEEEVEQMMAPEYDHVDGVAAPDERAEIELIPAFDPETVSIIELDVLVGACIESDIATEAEVFGEEEFDEESDGDEGGADEWCDELANLSADEIAEFAAEDGAEVVSAEFGECGLEDPLSS